MATDKTVMAVIRAARPSFRNIYDKIAFAVHATFLASGHVLIATGPPAFSDNALSSTSTEEVGIEEWNEQEDEYAFVYINPEKDWKKVLVKCLVISDKFLVDALPVGAPEPLHLEINPEDYVGGNGGTNYSTQYKNLEGLVKTLDTQLLSKLYASPQPPPSSETSETSSRNVNIEVPIGGPSSPQTHPSGIIYPPVYPSGVSDIFPSPGAGMYPTRPGFGTGGGSMYLGPNDPRWRGMVGDPVFPGGIGGDPGFPGGLPGVPPGARFDPYGPPGVPGFEPNRFTRDPRRPGRGTHPDLEHFGGGSDFI
ncbi:probable proteasome inhibitor [Quercus lobata]|uniref:probable proteasome inhibitor n=1 Tax=Quercus lobata TaxID=97700 RepID=UPI0012458AB5|nr:probable proteasome inhibitor [Quercus lobata]